VGCYVADKKQETVLRLTAGQDALERRAQKISERPLLIYIVLP
jgi:hypothetical protein